MSDEKTAPRITPAQVMTKLEKLEARVAALEKGSGAKPDPPAARESSGSPPATTQGKRDDGPSGW